MPESHRCLLIDQLMIEIIRTVNPLVTLGESQVGAPYFPWSYAERRTFRLKAEMISKVQEATLTDTVEELNQTISQYRSLNNLLIEDT